MSLLIINADDFGYSKGINLGIVDAHREGILSSTTMMANMPGFEHGVQMAKENPDLGIGVHLVLTAGKPVRHDVPSLINKDEFHHISFYEKDFSIDLDELYREWDAQINKIKDAGIHPTHMDTHHHVNIIPSITEVFVKLARKHDLPVRNNFIVPEDVNTTNKFFTEFDNLGSTKELWKPFVITNLIKDCKKYGTVEIMCHPGYVDHVLLESSTLLDNRVYTVKELQNPAYKNILKENGIQLATYKDIIS
ncbi:hypothetical protein SAMN05421734_101342 [Pelagirhabdus alkalitolerans]|uniref:Carbohydrate deacetylase n=1 Tax=Pelagirhabdus alkalitolerans TaxID=1612202 RepID=A0A1G6GP57_9BACI|nr:carbohydrate deacetylase [Pelagirhabdus alkalitolerans]SDB83724.1 hypothetical protein SAMN05421734_101342 [Pelagirhabdus alkalitolerans]